MRFRAIKALELIQRARYNRILGGAFKSLFLNATTTKPSADGTRVLAHLRNFCSADETTWRLDPMASAQMQGRREVWLEIAYYLNLDDRDFAEVDRTFKTDMEDRMKSPLNGDGRNGWST